MVFRNMRIAQSMFFIDPSTSSLPVPLLNYRHSFHTATRMGFDFVGSNLFFGRTRVPCPCFQSRFQIFQPIREANK